MIPTPPPPALIPPHLWVRQNGLRGGAKSLDELGMEKGVEVHLAPGHSQIENDEENNEVHGPEQMQQHKMPGATLTSQADPN